MKKNKDASIFLKHILESIALIEKYTKNINYDDFLEDMRSQDAVMKRLEVIGEAVKNLPTELREENPDIPWKKITATRDILIHHYFGVEMEVVWEIVRKDIIELKFMIESLLKRTS